MKSIHPRLHPLVEALDPMGVGADPVIYLLLLALK